MDDYVNRMDSGRIWLMELRASWLEEMQNNWLEEDVDQQTWMEEVHRRAENSHRSIGSDKKKKK